MKPQPVMQSLVPINSTDLSTNCGVANEHYCCCEGPESGKMIACGYSDCPYNCECLVTSPPKWLLHFWCQATSLATIKTYTKLWWTLSLRFVQSNCPCTKMMLNFVTVGRPVGDPENIQYVPTDFTFSRERSAVNKRQSEPRKDQKKTNSWWERGWQKIKRLLQMLYRCFGHQKRTMMLQHRLLCQWVTLVCKQLTLLLLPVLHKLVYLIPNSHCCYDLKWR